MASANRWDTDTKYNLAFVNWVHRLGFDGIGHLQHARTSEHRLPLPVEKEMRAYLECGILAYGFVRARCEDCGASRAVVFSCKKRGFCPSCSGRRMADTAAHLVDEVLPRAPVRQWVLSFPYEMRYRLAYDGEWVSKVLAVFLRVVGRWYRRQAQAMGHGNARWGSVTFVQRFGSSLNLNPHVHVLMLDGVYVDGEEAPVFVAAPPLSDPAVQQIVQTSARRILALTESPSSFRLRRFAMRTCSRL